MKKTRGNKCEGAYLLYSCISHAPWSYTKKCILSQAFLKEVNSNIKGYLAHFSAHARKIKKIHPEKMSYIAGKWNFLALVLNNLLCFVKRKLFSYFRKQKLRKIFFYISENGKPKKVFIFQETELFLYFRKGIL